MHVSAAWGYRGIYGDEYISVIVSFRTGCVDSKMLNHPRGLDLPFLRANRDSGRDSPVSGSGLHRGPIKGSRSREPVLFGANRMSKCSSLCSLPKSLSKQQSSAVPAQKIFHSMDVRANETTT